MDKLKLCDGASLLNIGNQCCRNFWSSVIPLALVVIFLFLALPFPRQLSWLFSPFWTFLPLPEAESILQDETSVSKSKKYDLASLEHQSRPKTTNAPIWRTAALSFLAISEALTWLALGTHGLYEYIEKKDTDIVIIATPFVMTTTWWYATLRPMVRPKATPPYDLFVLFLVHWVWASLNIAIPIYMHYHAGWYLPTVLTMVAMITNLITITILLLLVLTMPLAIPSETAKALEKDGKINAPEDYTTLWGWITFSWVDDLVYSGFKKELAEGDVAEMSPSMRSKPVYERFMDMKRSSLLRQVAAANSLDILLEIGLVAVGTILGYATPYFLKKILDDISNNDSPSTRSSGYIFAILSFLAAVAKAETDVQHLWFGRRAATRAKTSLQAAVYVKALARKDFSGVTKKEEEKAAKVPEPTDRKGKKAAKAKAEEAAKETEKKSAADVGKIVQLMSADSNQVAMFFSWGYMLYSAPFEIAIASYMLYQLLGWSAFVGFGVLVIASPLNHMLSKQNVKIERALKAARDKRMAALNELIAGIKFIKFFAWEGQWIKRVQDARAFELSWLIKERINSIFFMFLWMLAPTGVAVVSFAAYVMTGHELTIPVAFTAIALFNMLKMPLNVIPMFIVELLQAGVALERIETFLKEDEVPDYVSSFKRTVLTTEPTEEDYRIGITGASFAWNQTKSDAKVKPEAKKSTFEWIKYMSALSTPAKKPADASNPEAKKSMFEWLKYVSALSTPSRPVLPTAMDVENPEVVGSCEAVEDHFELKDIDVLFPVGQLSLVVGPTASGKSALLMALLGEMTLIGNHNDDDSSPIHLPKNPFQLDSHTQLRNCISYCAQTPWLEHATIKENILFGAPFEEERYQEVIRACALEPDLKVLEDKDQTEIGSRGVSLSGGQKARVALARAVYARTKHVLLDDPLAAVDSHTARHLYDNVLLGCLMENRTCILVTHHVDLVQPGAHYLVRMLDGRIDTQGTIKDLEARGLLEGIVQDSILEIKDKDASGNKTPSDDAETIAEAAIEGKTVVEVKKASDELAAIGAASASGSTVKTPKRLVKDEERAKGNVKFKIYKTYLEASRYATWVWLLFGIAFYQVYGILEKLWLRTWSDHYEDQVLGNLITASYHYGLGYSTHAYHAQAQIPLVPLHAVGWSNTTNILDLTAAFPNYPILDKLPSANKNPMFYVAIYGGIGVAAALTSTLNSIVQYTGSYRASKILFTRLLTAIVGSPMRFFDTTPSGRILNRFSSDVATVDSSLSGSLRSTTNYIGAFIAAIITIVVVLPPFALPAAIITYFYYRLSKGYIVTGRMLRRMESTTRSPIFAAFGDVLEGLVTVRAFSSERRFVDRTHAKVDVTIKMWYGFWMTNRWLLVRFDTLSALSVLLTTIFALARLDAGLAGLAITSAMGFTMSVYWACRYITQLEMDLNSVERVVEYLDLPQEPPTIVESNRVPAYWPSTNSEDLVVVEDLVIKYAPDLPPVLHGISFNLKPRERVGLLGRTGSGKSTLAMALLRFVDPSEGSIIIDGIDISKIGLKDLRSRVTIIPQDAVLFSGSIRENLDPFNEHTDEECLDALGRVHLNTNESSGALASRRASAAPSIHEESGAQTPLSVATSQTVEDFKQGGLITLKTKVSAGGANFSQGQRQLIAMARALLRQSSIIIMDEATSSIDFAADSAVQKTIREEFTNALLITIAHRIRTIIDYDRLIVMDQGRIVEIDTPYNLIQKEGGVFRGMCLKSGQFDELLEASKGGAH
ncbi:hypothetical protein FRB95_004816 [Tulasnella sp. JGI-2019a]|nr:hypothetical protein FRB95_004816 [Tulasnella sp. JGI-2019a]